MMEKIFSNKAQIPAAAYRFKVIRLSLLPVYALILVVLHFGFDSPLATIVIWVLLFSAVNYVLILCYLRIMRPFRSGITEPSPVLVETEKPVTEKKLPAEKLTGYNPFTFISFGFTAANLILLFAFQNVVGLLFGALAAFFSHVAAHQILKEKQNGVMVNRAAMILAYVGMLVTVVGFFFLVNEFIQNYQGGVHVPE